MDFYHTNGSKKETRGATLVFLSIGIQLSESLKNSQNNFKAYTFIISFRILDIFSPPFEIKREAFKLYYK